jgi:hypothetical protein
MIEAKTRFRKLEVKTHLNNLLVYPVIPKSSPYCLIATDFGLFNFFCESSSAGNDCKHFDFSFSDSLFRPEEFVLIARKKLATIGRSHLSILFKYLWCLVCFCRHFVVENVSLPFEL